MQRIPLVDIAALPTQCAVACAREGMQLLSIFETTIPCFGDGDAPQYYDGDENSYYTKEGFQSLHPWYSLVTPWLTISLREYGLPVDEMGSMNFCELANYFNENILFTRNLWYESPVTTQWFVAKGHDIAGPPLTPPTTCLCGMYP
ncbi:MAG: hypothetical protein V1848_02315 [Candidatus Magasanikbacteria bacterium]